MPKNKIDKFIKIDGLNLYYYSKDLDHNIEINRKELNILCEGHDINRVSMDLDDIIYIYFE